VAEPLIIKDCALVSIATGRRAQSLRELELHLRDVEASSIFNHFWGSRLRPRFTEPEYQNDFAAWVRHELNDQVLAERLGILDPTRYHGIEELREAVLDVVEQRLGEVEFTPWVPSDAAFPFLRSQVVVFDTGLRIADVAELGERIAHLSLGSVYYHFIDARQRVEGRRDDFRAWLEQFGDSAAPLRDRLATIDPYFCSLTQLRARLGEAFGA